MHRRHLFSIPDGFRTVWINKSRRCRNFSRRFTTFEHSSKRLLKKCAECHLSSEVPVKSRSLSELSWIDDRDRMLSTVFAIVPSWNYGRFVNRERCTLKFHSEPFRMAQLLFWLYFPPIKLNACGEFVHRCSAVSNFSKLTTLVGAKHLFADMDINAATNFESLRFNIVSYFSNNISNRENHHLISHFSSFSFLVLKIDCYLMR